MRESACGVVAGACATSVCSARAATARSGAAAVQLVSDAKDNEHSGSSPLKRDAIGE